MCERMASRPYYFDGVSTVARQERKVIEGPGRVTDILIAGAAVGTILTLRDGDKDGRVIFKYAAVAISNLDAAGGLNLGFDGGLYVEFTPAVAGASATVAVVEPESGVIPTVEKEEREPAEPLSPERVPLSGEPVAVLVR